MSNAADILRLRVLLCFLKSDANDCTVTGIAKTLSIEKYVVSRVLATLEKEDLINREDTRNPIITEKGYRYAVYYSERLEMALNHFLCHGVDVESAKQDAFNAALYCSEKTMEAIRTTEERYRVKYELLKQKQFSGSAFCKRLKDGCYPFPFFVSSEHAENGQPLSSSNDCFAHPCTLRIEKGVGVIRLRAKLPLGANPLNSPDIKLKYGDAGRYISAESNGQVFSFPAEVLHFVNIGSGTEPLLHGSVGIQIETAPACVETAIFTILV